MSVEIAVAIRFTTTSIALTYLDVESMEEFDALNEDEQNKLVEETVDAIQEWQDHDDRIAQSGQGWAVVDQAAELGQDEAVNMALGSMMEDYS